MSSSLLGVDVGAVRVGVAVARLDVRIAQPLTTLTNDASIYDALVALVDQHQATAVVVGWPRGLNGQSTEQTRLVEQFADDLRSRSDVPVYLQDEALTSHKAETELQARKRPYQKAEVDALAASYILSDYMESLTPTAHLHSGVSDV